MRNIGFSIIWLGASLLCLAQAVAQDTVLPEPLTLEAALQTAGNQNHPELYSLAQRIAAIEAELGIARGDQGFSLDLKARLSEVEPSDFNTDDETNDSAASLVLSKPIYDFGLQSSLERSLQLQHDALQLQRQLKFEQREITILEQYFAVLNADNEFIAENEALAMGFIRYDNALQDQALGLAAEIEVLRLHSDYQKVRQRRSLAEQRQRLTRALLAATMGYPTQLPSALEIPKFATDRPPLPEFEALAQRALEQSLEVRVAQANTGAAQAAISIAETEDNPSVDFEIEVSHYERESRLRDDWRASLYFEIPLYSAASPAKVERAVAQHRQALASQQQVQSKLRLEVLELWQQIEQWRLVLEGTRIEQEYRDRYLDRSRAEYELEFKTDLGDSMVLYSRSNAEHLRARYALELAYRKLGRLVGSDFLAQPALPQ